MFDVSLQIPEGKVLALLGSNGAGKTTIARIASGLVRPTAGEVFFEGVRIDADALGCRHSRAWLPSASEEVHQEAVDRAENGDQTKR